ncbi:MAG: putative toxin-antitoxin system toxin component, PIN family [Deltaproteobacteria bacterium]|nr:putative toxin-antitoxin system toxin component, PIN family [Deltaproteobacteria bacterium]MBW2067766.1 putative toxin-antitoxin system toxin component, PIN family [Deltaproteobacteria bacterium]
MKVVLDTNVLISGIFFSGLPSKILSHWRKGTFTTVVSQPIISEYTKVAEEISKKYPQINIYEILELFILNSEVVDTGNLKITVCEDPDDNKFLECAIAGNCDMIISGDKHLLKLHEYRGVKILKPKEFVDNYLSHNI